MKEDMPIHEVHHVLHDRDQSVICTQTEQFKGLAISTALHKQFDEDGYLIGRVDSVHFTWHIPDHYWDMTVHYELVQVLR